MAVGLEDDISGSQGNLIGRQCESRALGDLLSQLPSGGAARILRGRAGAGKSALLAEASHNAESRGMRAWTVGAVRAEMNMPLAGLHQLLRLLLGWVDDLSRAHREVLLGSFGMDNAPMRDARSIALATLELFAEVSRHTPVLVAVDDAHWLDAESAEVLGFVARRLGSDPVALLMAVREGYETDLLNFNIPELYVAALDEKASSALLARTAPSLSPTLQEQILALAAGNPLVLVELPATAESATSVFDRPNELVTTKRLQTAFAERFLDLPPATRLMLLVRALDEDATLNEILAATEVMGKGCEASIDDLAPAVDASLVERSELGIQFLHPLTPPAIYSASADTLRRRVHAALATTLADHPHRRAWHRAASVSTPDETMGHELEAAAMSSRAMGRAKFRIASLERAAKLSTDPGVQQRRLLRAAELALDLGQRKRADRLLSGMDGCGCSPLHDVRRMLLRDLIEVGFVRDAQSVEPLVVAGIAAGSDGDPAVALRLLRAAAELCWWSGQGTELRARISEAGRSVAPREDEPVLLSILAMCQVEGSDEALLRIADRAPGAVCDAEGAFSLGSALHFSGSFDRSNAYLAEAIQQLRFAGYAWYLPEALALQAWNGIYVHDLNTAESAADKAVVAGKEFRQPIWEAMGKNVLAIVHAIRGNTSVAETYLAEAESIAVPIGASAVLADAQLTRAIIAFSTGSYEEAFDHLERTFDPSDPVHHYQRSAWRIGELAEAAVHAGRIDEARGHLLSINTREPNQSAPNRLEVGVLYARALLANDDEAEGLFEAALDRDLRSWPAYRARLLLHYGMWLRRQRKISLARMPLRAARDSLTALGACVWVERARQELRASREKQHSGPESRFVLTEQELQIAKMAAQGLSNREIGQQLYISPRTVGCHLYRIFPKLGVASRTQLSTVLDDRESAAIAS
ncbi:MAG TPA: LuxR C-terminal-related transcriptional regulator [Acidimicrobiales bacterium]